MSKALIIIPWFDPAFKAGGPVQSIANLVSTFNEAVQYKIFCGNKDVDGSLLENIKTDSWVEYNNNTQIWYDSTNHPFRTFKNILSDFNPDILFIIGLFSFNYNIQPLLFCKSKKKILSVRGMLHKGALSQKWLKKKIFISFLKIFSITKKVFFHATDENEAKIVRNVFGDKSKVYIAGNFPKKIKAEIPINKKRNELSLVTIALISPMKNHLLILSALKEIKDNIEYHIIGAIKDKDYWQQCMKIINELPGNIKVTYHGEVNPKEVINYLNDEHVFIMPSKSENFGHAIIEALSAGKPVITSHNTPWNNLQENKAGLNVSLNVAEIKNAIDYFIKMSSEEYVEWSDAAVSFSKKAIDYKQLNIQYANMFLDNQFLN